MELYELNLVLDQVTDVGNLIKTKFLEIDKYIQNELPKDNLKNIQVIYSIGDGDSFHAALASEMAFGEFAKTTYLPREAMRFLEYEADHLKNEFPFIPLVIGISASGSSNRVVESLERVNIRNKEIDTLAIVGNPVSKVANVAKKSISVEIPNLGASPGIRTYEASLMGLIAIAIRIGEAKEYLKKEDVEFLHMEIIKLADVVDKTVEEVMKPAKIAARDLSGAKFISYVGSGPSYGTAMFSSAKLIETSGVFATAQDLEEWMHVEGLAYPLDYPVYMIAPPGKGYWRAAMLADYIKMLGHPIIAVVNYKDHSIKEKANYFFPIMGEMPESISPLVTHVSASLFAYFLAKELERLPFMTNIINR